MELDIHTCRFAPVRANTTAATKGLATIAGRRLNQSAANWTLGVYSALGPKSRRYSDQAHRDSKFLRYRARIHATRTILEQGGQCIEVASPLAMRV